jgi:hypothetical protein
MAMIGSIRTDFEAGDRLDREEWDIQDPPLNLKMTGKKTAT